MKEVYLGLQKFDASVFDLDNYISLILICESWLNKTKNGMSNDDIIKQYGLENSMHNMDMDVVMYMVTKYKHWFEMFYWSKAPIIPEVSEQTQTLHVKMSNFKNKKFYYIDGFKLQVKSCRIKDVCVKVQDFAKSIFKVVSDDGTVKEMRGSDLFYTDDEYRQLCIFCKEYRTYINKIVLSALMLRYLEDYYEHLDINQIIRECRYENTASSVWPLNKYFKNVACYNKVHTNTVHIDETKPVLYQTVCACNLDDITSISNLMACAFYSICALEHSRMCVTGSLENRFLDPNRDKELYEKEGTTHDSRQLNS